LHIKLDKGRGDYDYMEFDEKPKKLPVRKKK
jgi:hypothetical protein